MLKTAFIWFYKIKFSSHTHSLVDIFFNLSPAIMEQWFPAHFVWFFMYTTCFMLIFLCSVSLSSLSRPSRLQSHTSNVMISEFRNPMSWIRFRPNSCKHAELDDWAKNILNIWASVPKNAMLWLSVQFQFIHLNLNYTQKSNAICYLWKRPNYYNIDSFNEH